ncbi:unnamed protein product, partial [Brachionus calyciflorus]
MKLFFLVFLLFEMKNYSFTRLNDFCLIDKDIFYTPYSNTIIIKNISKISSLELVNNSCTKKITSLNRFIISNQNLLKTKNELKSLLDYNLNKLTNSEPYIALLHINGFQIEQETIFNFSNRPKQVNLIIGYSDFKFYFNNNLVKSCSQLVNFTTSSFMNQLSYSVLKIERSLNTLKLCPLIFENTFINVLSVSYFFETFYLKKNLNFESIDSTIGNNLNISIKRLDLSHVFNLNLNENLMNKYIFKELNTLIIAGDINSIQIDIFKHFTKLKYLVFDGQNFRNLIHKTGIDWIKSLNYNLTKINRHNYSLIYENEEKIIYINLKYVFFDYTFNYYDNDLIPLYNVNKTFPDEDFCLYIKFPFDQIVHLAISEHEYGKADDPYVSCTAFWLTYRLNMYFLYTDSIQNSKNNFESLKKQSGIYDSIKKCEFEKRLSLCEFKEKQNINLEKTPAFIESYSYFIMEIFDFVLIPFACFIGLVLNSLAILIVEKSRFKKDDKKYILFYYIKIYSISNCLICLILCFRLLYDWPFTYRTGK